MRKAKPTKPRIPWKKIWEEFDKEYDRVAPDRAGQRLLISVIIDTHLAPWGVVYWDAIWKQFEMKRGNLRGEFQELVRKQLQEPKR